MKLSTLKPLTESKKKLPEEVKRSADDALAEMLSSTNIRNHTINADGTIDIIGNIELMLMKPYQSDWPRINNVEGDFSWTFFSAKYMSFLPKNVKGKLSLTIKDPIKTSDLPRNDGSGTLLLLEQYSGVKLGTITVDDDTLSTYKTCNLYPPIIGGFEHLPTPWNTERVYIRSSTLDGLPSVINCKYLEIITDNAAALKGIHKKVHSITATGDVSFEFPMDTPVLGLIKLFKNQDLSVTISEPIERNGKFNVAFRGIVDQLTNSDKDIIEMQQELIDAGYGKFAKL